MAGRSALSPSCEKSVFHFLSLFLVMALICDAPVVVCVYMVLGVSLSPASGQRSIVEEGAVVCCIYVVALVLGMVMWQLVAFCVAQLDKCCPEVCRVNNSQVCPATC